MRKKNDEMPPPQKPPRKIGNIIRECFLLFLVSVLIIFIFGVLFCKFYVQHKFNTSYFSACENSLTSVRTGIESYRSKGGLLKKIDPYGNKICDYIMAGYAKATECENLGLIKKRMDDVCRAGTYKIKILDASRYEITGVSVSMAKHGIRICVTEATIIPENYDEGLQNPDATKCVH
jgi:hypothetical protein